MLLVAAELSDTDKDGSLRRFSGNGDKSLLREGIPEAGHEGETHQGTGQ